MKVQFVLLVFSFVIMGNALAIESINPVDQLPPLLSTSSDDSRENEASEGVDSPSEVQLSPRQPNTQPQEIKKKPSN